MSRQGRWSGVLGAVWAVAAHAGEPACLTPALVQQDVMGRAVAALAGKQSEQVQIELTPIGVWPAMAEPRLVWLDQSVRARMAASLTGKACDSGRLVTETVWFRVRALREAWVYGRNSPASTALSESAPRRERIDLAALQLAESELASSLDQQWLGQAVYAGRPVLHAQLRVQPLVRRDDLVQVVIMGPGLMLRAQGRALQAGGLGERVAVLVHGAESSMPATVSARGEVHVDVEM